MLGISLQVGLLGLAGTPSLHQRPSVALLLSLFCRQIETDRYSHARRNTHDESRFLGVVLAATSSRCSSGSGPPPRPPPRGAERELPEFFDRISGQELPRSITSFEIGSNRSVSGPTQISAMRIFETFSENNDHLDFPLSE